MKSEDVDEKSLVLKRRSRRTSGVPEGCGGPGRAGDPGGGLLHHSAAQGPLRPFPAAGPQAPVPLVPSTQALPSGVQLWAPRDPLESSHCWRDPRTAPSRACAHSCPSKEAAHGKGLSSLAHPKGPTGLSCIGSWRRQSQSGFLNRQRETWARSSTLVERRVQAPKK